jgi:hypothetical protein
MKTLWLAVSRCGSLGESAHVGAMSGRQVITYIAFWISSQVQFICFCKGRGQFLYSISFNWPLQIEKSNSLLGSLEHSEIQIVVV